jgi:hypothetical protein
MRGEKEERDKENRERREQSADEEAGTKREEREEKEDEGGRKRRRERNAMPVKLRKRLLREISWRWSDSTSNVISKCKPFSTDKSRILPFMVWLEIYIARLGAIGQLQLQPAGAVGQTEPLGCRSGDV